MASLVLSDCCGLRPLPAAICFRPKPRLPSAPQMSFVSAGGRPFLAGRFLRDWALRVSSPVMPVFVEKQEGEDVISVRKEEFDPGMLPPFGLAEIRAAIPKHCWVKNSWRSMSYVARDVVVVFGLAAAAAYINSWAFWPIYWVAQGTMFWALFVLGHDCGHGSFSNSTKLNSVVGHILHSSILVPYHGWRISHRTHHQNHGHVEKDESWHPLPENIYRSLDSITRRLRFTLPFPMLAFPIYLWGRSPGKSGSHFNPESDLFVSSERNDVMTSTACWIAMASLLAGLTWLMGPLEMFNLYAVPYGIFVTWLDLVTYLHHHGHDEKLPWYRGKEWNYFRGGLTTLDRDYGWINNIHHDIGTHVIHHLFPQIPHYHLVEAVSSTALQLSQHFFVRSGSSSLNLLAQQTMAAKPILGKYYREPENSGPLPLHLLQVLSRSLKQDHYVSDFGDIVYYEKDPELP